MTGSVESKEEVLLAAMDRLYDQIEALSDKLASLVCKPGKTYNGEYTEVVIRNLAGSIVVFDHNDELREDGSRRITVTITDNREKHAAEEKLIREVLERDDQ